LPKSLPWQTKAEGTEATAFELAASQPPTPETLCSTANLLAKQGRNAEGERLLKRTLVEYPDCPNAYCSLAEFYLRQRRVEEATRVLDAGARNCTDAPYLVNNLGLCWLAKGEHKRALATFTLAAGAVPENARYRANMATALGLLGRYEEALMLFEQVVPPADAHRNLAVLCEARNDMSRAAEARRRASSLQPSGGSK